MSTPTEADRAAAAKWLDARRFDISEITPHVERSLAALLAAARAEVLQQAAQIADEHEHAEDDIICGGHNCGMCIAGAIRALIGGGA